MFHRARARAIAQAIGFAVIQQGHRVLYREAYGLLDELADAQLAGTRKAYLAQLTTVPLLIIHRGIRDVCWPLPSSDDKAYW